VPLADLKRRVASGKGLEQCQEEVDECGQQDGAAGSAGAGVAASTGTGTGTGTGIDADTDVLYMYRRACRCGDSYEITSEELRQGFNTVQCGGCSLYITVVQ